ncbi:MAG: hypothetical protein NUW01_05610, partial [Gemmatimonadaceae bacterium]|nr:hypothetical protein [Gemmatimonadaceae bacterium]
LILPIMTTFLWFVRSARADLNRAHEDFTNYLQHTAGRQTEALLSVANNLERQIEISRQHEDRALRRHEQLVARTAGIERDRLQVSEMLSDVVHEVAANESAALKKERDQ